MTSNHNYITLRLAANAGTTPYNRHLIRIIEIGEKHDIRIGQLLRTKLGNRLHWWLSAAGFLPEWEGYYRGRWWLWKGLYSRVMCRTFGHKRNYGAATSMVCRRCESTKHG